jgi:hypothetical protein
MEALSNGFPTTFCTWFHAGSSTLKMDPSETVDRSTPLSEIINTINQGARTLLSPFNGMCAYVFPIKFACTREYDGRINLQYTCIGSLHEHAH